MWARSARIKLINIRDSRAKTRPQELKARDDLKAALPLTLFHSRSSVSRLLGFALQGAIQGLIEGGLGLLVFRLRDLALPAFDFELEEFLF